MPLTSSVDDSGGEDGKAHRVSQSVGRTQEERRVCFVLSLIEGAVGDDLSDIIGHTRPVEW
jgi:hypothetical protein